MQKRIMQEVIEGGEKRVEIAGSPVDIMCMAGDLLSASLEALERHPDISHEDAMKLMDEVVESYQVEAHHGKEAAKARALVQFFKHC